MFVSDPTFPAQVVKIKVLNTDGGEWSIDASPDFSIQTIKVMALGHFYNPVEAVQPKMATQFKLVLVSEGRTLQNESTVVQEAVKENDELLLLKCHPPNDVSTETQEEKEQKYKGPSESAVNEQSSSLSEPPANVSTSMDESTPAMDFQTELRRILVSLVDASQKILKYNPEALALVVGSSEVATSPPEEKTNPTLVKQLTDMGFKEDKVIEALKQNNMCHMAAMEWLLGHVEVSGTPVKPTEPSRQPTPPPVHFQSVWSLLEAFKAHKRKEFRANHKALNNLKEMGFSEQEVIDALRITNNNQDTACEWLLGDRKPKQEELEVGLDSDGAVCKAIMANPVIQLGLNNPKTLIAFLHMLENPTSANHWLSDPDTAPLLTQIFRIYHAEKHSLQINAPIPQTTSP